MALTCFLFPVFGLMARGVASGPTVRLKPTSLGGEGNEIERRDNCTDATGLHHYNSCTPFAAVHESGDGRFRGEADTHDRVASTKSVADDPGCVKTPCFM